MSPLLPTGGRPSKALLLVDVIRLSKLLLKSFWIFAKKQRLSHKVDNMTNTSNPALEVIELELRTKGLNTGVVI
jgi:hypothetical protein